MIVCTVSKRCTHILTSSSFLSTQSIQLFGWLPYFPEVEGFPDWKGICYSSTSYTQLISIHWLCGKLGKWEHAIKT